MILRKMCSLPYWYKRMLEILEKITPATEQWKILKTLKIWQTQSSPPRFALGQTAPNPILSTLKYFEDEYMAHVVEKDVPQVLVKTCLAM